MLLPRGARERNPGGGLKQCAYPATAGLDSPPSDEWSHVGDKPLGQSSSSSCSKGSGKRSSSSHSVRLTCARPRGVEQCEDWEDRDSYVVVSAVSVALVSCVTEAEAERVEELERTEADRKEAFKGCTTATISRGPLLGDLIGLPWAWAWAVKYLHSSRPLFQDEPCWCKCLCMNASRAFGSSALAGQSWGLPRLTRSIRRRKARRRAFRSNSVHCPAVTVTAMNPATASHTWPTTGEGSRRRREVVRCVDTRGLGWASGSTTAASSVRM
mmetsp:Transcript_38857/g.69548  ORF Transcript_38857/g.69548 Transcript_38857/m.69548 type:complete len:270 (-) Transcript_38857:2324-3133(-)